MDKELRLVIEEENEIMFKKSIRKLLEKTFLPENKDPAIYDFLSSESNLQDVNDYMELIGFRIAVFPVHRLAMLQQIEENDEIQGLKMANVERFSSHEIHIMLILMATFLENYGNGAMVVTTKGEIVDKIKAYEVNVDSRKLSGAMKKFQKYYIIETDLDSKDEMTPVVLYPSVMFGWLRDQLEAYITENIRREDEASSDDDIDDNSDYDANTNGGDADDVSTIIV